MTGGRTRSGRCALAAGSALIVSGIAHLVWPQAFESVNRMAFADHIQRHVLINGTIEAGLGLLLLTARTRRAAVVATAGYLTYFNTSLLYRQKFDST
ncbi:hypothetical protein [Mycobacterium sp. 360MFTsu5.1]|uniref:hypothetical protein n=1 Tax=Mycobacterium sp. 360MFTsu5.1 TaxID=1172186 RepID=UPI0003720875|nr:hypothetical protein [Mycobacterium sp. 360MFTsu5.1]